MYLLNDNLLYLLFIKHQKQSLTRMVSKKNKKKILSLNINHTELHVPWNFHFFFLFLWVKLSKFLVEKLFVYARLHFLVSG